MGYFIAPIPATKRIQGGDCADPDRVNTGDAKAAACGRVTELEGAEPELGRPKAL